MAQMTSKRILVAMSGGVDSSVAAHLLVEKIKNFTPTYKHNMHIMGLFMRNWSPLDEEGNTRYCEASERDWKDAERVCQQLGIPLHRHDFVREYWTGVFEPFVHEIASNITPNPDIMCNSAVKFGAMKDYACRSDTLAADLIATGHYARLARGSSELDEMLAVAADEGSKSSSDDEAWLAFTSLERNTHSFKSSNDPDYYNNLAHTPMLLSAVDRSKDQSYFLCGTKDTALRNVLFPLGDLYKTTRPNSTPISLKKRKQSNRARELSGDDDYDDDVTVRDIAHAANLTTASKRESMGICFVGKRKFPQFISEYLPDPMPGRFICVDTGEVVGKHSGSALITIGQGAKIGGASQKWFVTHKHPNTGDVFVCGGTHHPALYVDEFFTAASSFNWIGGRFASALSNGKSLRALCRVRHLQPLIECEISLEDGDRLVLRTFRPLRAVTPGQTVSVYIANGDICLGGAPIIGKGSTYYERGLVLPNDIHPSGSNDSSYFRRIIS